MLEEVSWIFAWSCIIVLFPVFQQLSNSGNFPKLPVFSCTQTAYRMCVMYSCLSLILTILSTLYKFNVHEWNQNMLKQEHWEKFIISFLLNKQPSSKLLFVNILDGDECNRKINLLPRVEHEQIFIGSLFEWSESIKGNQ